MMKRKGILTFIAAICFLSLLAVTGPVEQAWAQMTPEDMAVIEEGFRLFHEETFDGNGRTCATCHLASKAYTISPADIAKLKGRKLDLVLLSALPDFENEDLVKVLGLFNIGEFFDSNDMATGQFRSSMSLNALELTTNGTNATGNNITLGWSGEGSPDVARRPDFPCRPGAGVDPMPPVIGADGSIEAFTQGAIVQHFTLSAARVPGTDFRCATQDELIAMGKFQRWLGRRMATETAKEFDLRDLSFENDDVELGKIIFRSNKTKCRFCHIDGGADGPSGRGPINRNRDTGTEVAGHDLLDDVANPPVDDVGEDEEEMNLQSIIEAARKGTFFHNSLKVTNVEDASRFYFSEDFTPPFLPGGLACFDEACLDLEPFGGNAISGNAINKLGAFLRSLSAYYGIVDTIRLVQEAIDLSPAGASYDLQMLHGEFNMHDVVKVLKGNQLDPSLYSDVREAAGDLEEVFGKASKTNTLGKLNNLLGELESLRVMVATFTP